MARRRLPPLKAVRAFEAAARHGHFEHAGTELGVTAGAIAQQVKILETWLGLELFRRLPAKGVALTGAGERYAGGRPRPPRRLRGGDRPAPAPGRRQHA